MDTFISLFDDKHREIISKTKLEGSIYSIRKFARLALNCNPNILDALFCRDEHIKYVNDLGLELLANRSLFISSKAKHAFSGYASAQLKRIKSHRSWALNPKDSPPDRESFGLGPNMSVSRNSLKAARDAVDKRISGWDINWDELQDSEKVHISEQMNLALSEMMLGLNVPMGAAKMISAARSIGINDNFIEVLEKELSYERAVNDHKKYVTWKRTRNGVRFELETKFGYDTKHGAHLYRLLKMCREILETGKVNVCRVNIDADEIIAIRAGEWSYDKLIEWHERESASLDELYQSGNYAVRKAPDWEKVESLVVRIIEKSFK